MHTGYGLLVDSDLPLPELAPAPSTGTPDVVIRTGSVPPPGADASLLPLGLWLDGERIGLDVPDVGRFAVDRGTAITVDALPGTAPDVVRLFLLGTAFGALMLQRGHLVLHGNAFRVGDACAVVLGHSGAGKSTLAAEMHRRGFDVLSDDVVPVDAQGRALPGWPRIKLWQDALDRLGRDSAGLRRVRAEHAKFHVPLDRPALEPLPVRWLYALDRHDGPLRLTPVTGAAVFTTLHEHSYRNELLVGPHRRTHLARSAVLAASARLARLDRPRGTDSVAASAEAVLADIGRDVPLDLLDPGDLPGLPGLPDLPAVREDHHAQALR
ncbi:hypothetical protein L615_000600000410 [Nocardioides sp. J9]|uniref:hypothetical protein n=1 Tax=Nocardioides sp. J9 TaxID=935844 RepID=UPI0011A0032A|nr:hypothetical protein [Nocardioides sp. J9]TWG93928.1 hypothetical protein L615_000600000410 [Nocardioides sp. J9]